MADVAAANWDETDANNDDAAPDGFPEGMAPSGVNNGARAIMGAVKRFWNKINAVKTTAGTTSAYTLSYDVAPGAYYDGEIISFVVNATNAAAATINVNALGAKPLRLFAGNLLAGALLTDQIVQARYSSAAGAFDIIPQHGWVRIGSVNPSAASAADLTGIPAGVNNLMCAWALRPNTDQADITIQTYGADGVLDTGGSDYYFIGTTSNSSGATTATTAVSTSATLAFNVDNGVHGTSGRFEASDIQAATYTKFTGQSSYLDFGGSVAIAWAGTAVRQEADRITGIRFLPSGGTFTGRITLFGSA